MDEQLTKCIKFAHRAHAGQKDKGGADYIGHPLRVMDGVNTTEEKITAILHDILEDTCFTLGDLKRTLNLSDKILEALGLLTRKRGESYMTYIESLTESPLAVAVKISDLKDNLNLDRLNHVTEHDLARCEKYRQALEYLYKVTPADH